MSILASAADDARINTRRYFRRRLIVWGLLFLAILLILAYYVPTGWVLVGPGKILSVLPATEIVWASPPSGGTGAAPDGEVLMLTVSAQPANLYRLAAWAAGFVPYATALRTSDLVPTGLSEAEYLAYSTEQMAESVGIAATVAHRALGLAAAATGSGVRVVGLTSGRVPATGGPQPGDIILVAGTPVAMSGDLAPILRGRNPGQSVLLEIWRDERLVTVEAPIVAAPVGADESRLGVALLTVNARFATLHAVRVDTDGITGPSGGLALALAAYLALGGEDVLDGRVVAATGYIRADAAGTIGPVGGVMFKAIAAAQAGADLMLVHPTNLAEAKAAGTGVEIVAVASFSDAIDYLRRSSLTGPK